MAIKHKPNLDMLKSTEQKAIEFVHSKGGVVEKIIKEKGKHYYHIICVLGHPFKKEKKETFI